jgi:recombinational DNA repair protein (RecF pathway)
VDVVAFAFESGLLRTMGSFPRTDVCLGCEQPWKKREVAVFHPLSGGAYHLRCAREKRIDGPHVTAGSLHLLRQFAEDRVPKSGRVSLSPAVARDMRTLLDTNFRFLLERDLRTSRFR